MKEKKKLFTILSIVLLIILVLGATYAYFAAQTGDASSTDINVTTATVDNLTFETGEAISINATQTNFASGMTSLSDDTYAKATLVANNDTNSASANYYVYLNISTNDFVYTTSDSTAELILTITDPNGDVVETLSNLTYITVTDSQGVSYSGFDITTWGGLIPIAESYAITATGESVTQDWTVTLTFVNLVSDQSDNAGASIDIDLIIQDSEIVLTTLADYIISQYSEDGVNNLYYFDGSGSYTNADLEADDLSYRYSGASDEVSNYVCFGSYASTCDTDDLYRIIGVFKNEDTREYEAKLIKYDYATSDLLGIDGDYYTYYSDESSGMDYQDKYLGFNNLSDVGVYYWNGINYYATFEKTGYYNLWSYSQLNTVNLNQNYYNSFDTIWQNMISEHTWIIGGNTLDNLQKTNALSVYTYEISNPNSDIEVEYSTNIGLVYISDYAFAADPMYWSYKGYDSSSEIDYREAISNNWMYMGLHEWTITRRSDALTYNFVIDARGCFQGYGYTSGDRAVRPTFYLNSSVTVTSGDGSYSSPYRISMS